jgi:GntR family transcriptional regulator
MEDAPAQPLYRHVYETILGRIVSGELRPGVMLPSETALGKEMGVSQGTARKALIELERNGIVERRQGRGTVVATTTAETDHFHFFRLRHADGTDAAPSLESETLVQRRATAAERTAFGAGMEAGAQVHAIDRIRSIAGRRIVRESSVVPVSLFPDLESNAPLPNALYAFYQHRFGIAVGRAEESLRAAIAGPEDAIAMDVQEGTPLIEVERRAIDLSGRTVELRRSRYVTDDLAYAVTLQ